MAARPAQRSLARHRPLHGNAGRKVKGSRSELPRYPIVQFASTASGRRITRDTVLDLGSGGGIDVLLSARRVGPTGKAYGLEMTNDMLALARENQRKARATNVERDRQRFRNRVAPARGASPGRASS